MQYNVYSEHTETYNIHAVHWGIIGVQDQANKGLWDDPQKKFKEFPTTIWSVWTSRA